MPFRTLVPFALGGGLMESLAFAPFGAWPLAFLAVATMALLMRNAARPRDAVALGLAYGLAFNLVTLDWQASVLVASYLGLAAIQAAYFGLLGGLLYSVRSLRWTPLASACCWVLVEAVQARFPFGGFGWTRLGYAMVDTPLAGFYPLVGVRAVSPSWWHCWATPRRGSWRARSRRRAAVAPGSSSACIRDRGAGVPSARAPRRPRPPSTSAGCRAAPPAAASTAWADAGLTAYNHAAETQRLLASGRVR